MKTILKTTKNRLVMQQPSNSFYRIVYFLERKLPWNIYTNQFRNVTESKEVKEISRSIIQIRIHSISFPQLFCAILSFFPTLKAKVTMFLLKKLHHLCVWKSKVWKKFPKTWPNHCGTHVLLKRDDEGNWPPVLSSLCTSKKLCEGYQCSSFFKCIIFNFPFGTFLYRSRISGFCCCIFKCCWQHWGHP